MPVQVLSAVHVGSSGQTWVFPGRITGPGPISAEHFCRSKLWSPVFLDDEGQSASTFAWLLFSSK